MTTAIVTVHFRNGIWNTDGGFEFNLALVACAYVVSALGPGSHSLNNAFDIGNWAGIDWSMSAAGRAGIVVAIGAVCGLLPVLGAAMTRPVETDGRSPCRPATDSAQGPRWSGNRRRETAGGFFDAEYSEATREREPS
jgi:putative oxidoreductase